MEERRAYIIDDERLLRRMVRHALEDTCGEIDEFDSAEAFLSTNDHRPAGCIIVDIRLPGIDGLDLLEILSADRMGHAVIVMSAHGSVPYAVRAGRLGVVDFIEKPFLVDPLRTAVERAFELLRMRRSSPVEALGTLTPREKQVLVSFATGAANKIVAYQLGLSVRTVELHRANMMRKLGVRNLGQALLLAKDGGYV
jgi:two-component system, LuxR family, response regulator FixJ